MSGSTIPAFLVAQVDVKDLADYIARYALPSAGPLQKHGGEILVASPTLQIKEGSWHGNWTVVIRFPDMVAAQAYYEDPDYAPLKALRINELAKSSNLILVGGFDPVALGL
jgi:uncharacterized protein (DUF1330 family)